MSEYTLKMIARYKGIYARSEQRATQAYADKDMSRYMVQLQKLKDCKRILATYGVTV